MLLQGPERSTQASHLPNHIAVPREGHAARTAWWAASQFVCSSWEISPARGSLLHTKTCEWLCDHNIAWHYSVFVQMDLFFHEIVNDVSPQKLSITFLHKIVVTFVHKIVNHARFFIKLSITFVHKTVYHVSSWDCHMSWLIFMPACVLARKTHINAAIYILSKRTLFK